MMMESGTGGGLLHGRENGGSGAAAEKLVAPPALGLGLGGGAPVNALAHGLIVAPPAHIVAPVAPVERSLAFPSLTVSVGACAVVRRENAPHRLPSFHLPW
jgi:hypothetical protein